MRDRPRIRLGLQHRAASRIRQHCGFGHSYHRRSPPFLRYLRVWKHLDKRTVNDRPPPAKLLERLSLHESQAKEATAAKALVRRTPKALIEPHIIDTIGQIAFHLGNAGLQQGIP